MNCGTSGRSHGPCQLRRGMRSRTAGRGCPALAGTEHLSPASWPARSDGVSARSSAGSTGPRATGGRTDRPVSGAGPDGPRWADRSSGWERSAVRSGRNCRPGGAGDRPACPGNRRGRAGLGPPDRVRASPSQTAGGIPVPGWPLCWWASQPSPRSPGYCRGGPHVAARGRTAGWRKNASGVAGRDRRVCVRGFGLGRPGSGGLTPRPVPASLTDPFTRAARADGRPTYAGRSHRAGSGSGGTAGDRDPAGGR